MSSRFGRDPARDDLFSSYNRSASPSKSKSKARLSPYASPGGYGLPSSSDGPGFSAYPSANANSSLYGSGSYSAAGAGARDDGAGYRSATPNSRGQYASATLDELESQNEEHTGVLIGKVKMLKDLTHLIGDEIRDSTTLAEKMNDQFENSRNKIKGTMNRMLRMAKKTGVGWKAWVAFFAALILLFWWVWLG
ncbi:protein transport protein bet1 [Ascochyta clinopodiicola]|nr:protein transport protein bet1 [Ascochyta clinopodiicola]